MAETKTRQRKTTKTTTTKTQKAAPSKPPTADNTAGTPPTENDATGPALAGDDGDSDDVAQSLVTQQAGSSDEAQDALQDEPSTDGPGAVYYGRRQAMRQGGMSSEEANEREEELREDGKLFDPES